jgi:hypothetical protein
MSLAIEQRKNEFDRIAKVRFTLIYFYTSLSGHLPGSIFSRDGDMASTQNLLIICRLNYRHVIRKFIHPRVSYSPLALPSGNMILLSEYIFIFPSPACNKCIMCKIDMKTIQGDREDSDNVVVEK